MIKRAKFVGDHAKHLNTASACLPSTKKDFIDKGISKLKQIHLKMKTNTFQKCKKASKFDREVTRLIILTATVCLPNTNKTLEKYISK